MHPLLFLHLDAEPQRSLPMSVGSTATQPVAVCYGTSNRGRQSIQLPLHQKSLFSRSPGTGTGTCSSSPGTSVTELVFKLRRLGATSAPPPIFSIEEQEALAAATIKVLQKQRQTEAELCEASRPPLVTECSASRFGSAADLHRNGMIVDDHAMGRPFYGNTASFDSTSDTDADTEDEELEASDSDDFSSDEDDESLWSFYEYFASLPGHDFFLRLPSAFVSDEYNWFELPDVFRCDLLYTDPPADGAEGRSSPVRVSYTFDELIDFILIESSEIDQTTTVDADFLKDAILLYYILHQRYLCTRHAQAALARRVEARAFGCCPRFFCKDQPLLPIGQSALPRKAALKLYCPNCQDLYVPAAQKHARLDGCGWGPTALHDFCRSVMFSEGERAVGLRRERSWPVYVPRIYGFRIARFDSVSMQAVLRLTPKDYK